MLQRKTLKVNLYKTREQKKKEATITEPVRQKMAPLLR